MVKHLEMANIINQKNANKLNNWQLFKIQVG